MPITSENKNGTTKRMTNNGNASVPFTQLLDEYTYQRPQRGQILNGKILKIEDDALFIDIGAKRDAIVPHQELDELGQEWLDNVTRGDEVPVYVTRTPLGNEELVVSLKKGLEQQDWERAEALLESEEIVELEVIGHNKGGLLVEFGRLRGFVPNSHVPALQHIRDRSQMVSRKAKKVGDVLPLRVIEVERRRRRLVLSATEAQKEIRLQQLQEMREGQVVEGQVAHIVDYGAFVDLGGINGLLHISRMDWQHVDHPSDVLSVGDEIEVMIESVDVERERISLNRKALIPSPWDTVEERRNIGDLIEGVITKVVDFGAFVELSSGIQGLIHISEIYIPDSGSVEEVLQEGDTVLARIIDMEPERERLSLSLRRVSATEEIDWMAQRQQDEQETAEETTDAEAEATLDDAEEETIEDETAEAGEEEEIDEAPLSEAEAETADAELEEEETTEAEVEATLDDAEAEAVEEETAEAETEEEEEEEEKESEPAMAADSSA